MLDKAWPPADKHFELYGILRGVGLKMCWQILNLLQQVCFAVFILCCVYLQVISIQQLTQSTEVIIMCTKSLLLRVCWAWYFVEDPGLTNVPLCSFLILLFIVYCWERKTRFETPSLFSYCICVIIIKEVVLTCLLCPWSTRQAQPLATDQGRWHYCRFCCSYCHLAFRVTTLMGRVYILAVLHIECPSA